MRNNSLIWASLVTLLAVAAGIHYHLSGNHEEYASARQEPGHYGGAIVSVEADKWVRWNGPSDSTVYMQVDDATPAFFAAASSGTQGAPWMTEGHVYTFILQDAKGNEIARDQLDLRSRRLWPR
jgi:hypothetical protein